MVGIMKPISAFTAFLAFTTQTFATPIAFGGQNLNLTRISPPYCTFCLADDVSNIAGSAISSGDAATMAQALHTIQTKIDSIPSGLHIGIPVNSSGAPVSPINKRDESQQGCAFCIIDEIGEAIGSLFEGAEKRSNPSLAAMTATLQNIQQIASDSITPEEQSILNDLKNITTVTSATADKRDESQQGCAFCIIDEIGEAIGSLFERDQRKFKRATPSASDLLDTINTIKGKISGFLNSAASDVSNLRRDESQQGCAFCIIDEVGEAIGSLFEGVERKRATPSVEAMTGALSDIFGIVNGTVTGPQKSALNYYKNLPQL